MTVSLDDQDEIEEVAARLVRRFPEVPEPSIRDVVTTAWSHFEGSKIRDFVPVLAERDAKAQLRVATT
jgi:hypothetical protein